MFRRLLAAMLALGAVSAAPAQSAEVTVYTTREPGLLRPLLEAFTAKTGTKVNTVFMQGGLAERVQSEGARSPADVMIVVDAGMLIDLTERGLTQAIQSPAIAAAVPATLRDPEGHWLALSMRARVIFVSKDRVSATEKPTYEDLANPRWKGKVCIRGGQHPYNTALFSAMLVKHGEAKLTEYLTALKANLARRPAGGDRDVAKDILAGTCDIGVANLYYAGLMASGKGGAEQQRWIEAVRVVLPTFSDKVGSHVNISGAAVAKHAPNKQQAIQLLEYLTGPDAQSMLAGGNFETPVRSGVAQPPTLAAFGTVVPDSVTPAQIAAGRTTASKLVDQTGFDR
jgi:iron(III) transport system substrate-binding protein